MEFQTVLTVSEALIINDENLLFILVRNWMNVVWALVHTRYAMLPCFLIFYSLLFFPSFLLFAPPFPISLSINLVSKITVMFNDILVKNSLRLLCLLRVCREHRKFVLFTDVPTRISLCLPLCHSGRGLGRWRGDEGVRTRWCERRKETGSPGRQQEEGTQCPRHAAAHLGLCSGSLETSFPFQVSLWPSSCYPS